MPEKPNILWIQCDEIRADSLSCYPGNPWIRPDTPNLQRLGDNSSVYDNMFCPSPVCMPSRGCEVTSRDVPSLGVYHNVTGRVSEKFSFDCTHPTWLRSLRDHGYRAINVGKKHIVAYDAWEESVGCRQFPNQRELVKEDPPEYDQIVLPGIRLAVGGTYSLDDGDIETFGGRQLTRMALRELETLSTGDAPWLLRVSYIAPHTPVLAPPPFDALYPVEQFACSDGSDVPHRAMSRYERSFAETQQSAALSPHQIARARATYHGVVSAIDAEVGLLLDAIADDCIVVFSGDHGAMLGEMGLWQKQMFNRKVHQVPFMLRVPGEGSRRVAQNADLLDLGPTLLGLCGIPISETFQGRNLLAEDVPEKDILSAFGYGDDGAYMYEALHLGPECPRRLCIRSGSHRLDLSILRNGRRLDGDEQDVFYCDTRTDPEERRNAATDPVNAEIVRDLRDRLIAWHDESDVAGV